MTFVGQFSILFMLIDPHRKQAHLPKGIFRGHMGPRFAEDLHLLTPSETQTQRAVPWFRVVPVD